MSPQVDMEKNELETLFVKSYDSWIKIVHINEVFVNIDEIQFIKVVEIKDQVNQEHTTK
jgi:phage tail tube protein FII